MVILLNKWKFLLPKVSSSNSNVETGSKKEKKKNKEQTLRKSEISDSSGRFNSRRDRCNSNRIPSVIHLRNTLRDDVLRAIYRICKRHNAYNRAGLHAHGRPWKLRNRSKRKPKAQPRGSIERFLNSRRRERLPVSYERVALVCFVRNYFITTKGRAKRLTIFDLEEIIGWAGIINVQT